jgi:guanine deaminase
VDSPYDNVRGGFQMIAKIREYKQPTTLYRGTFIHTPVLGSLEVIEHGIAGVDEDGAITLLETGKSVDEVIEQYGLQGVDVVDIDGGNRFFFPGFVDTHIHAPQYPNNGIFGNSTLLDWLTTYTFPLEASFKNLDKAKLVYDKVIERTLGNGTTCASYYATIDADATNLLADLCLQHGQRAFVGKVCMNQNSPDYYMETLEESKCSTLSVINHIKKIDPENNLVAPILTPRFAPSCTSELLHWLGKLKKEHGYHSQTHISENKNEIKWVHELFPESDTYTDVYNDHDLLDDKTILAHAIHLSDYEKDLIKKTGAGISHCPISNSAITSGECRVRWLLDNDIPVGLGTDVSGGFSPSILHVARQAILVSRHLAMSTGLETDKLSTEDVLYLATLGGAKLVGLKNRIGSFAIGKRWDVQLVDLDAPGSQVDVFEWQVPQKLDVQSYKVKWHNVIAKWLFNGDDRNTTQVWVNGTSVKA